MTQPYPTDGSADGLYLSTSPTAIDPQRPQQSTPPQAIHLQIDHLVIQGIAVPDRDRLGQVIQAELTRLFQEQGLPTQIPQGREVDRLRGSPLPLTPSMKGDRLGIEIAQRIYQSLG
ncbi:MAG: hypothetical protein VKJ24_08045 [Synechococcales bacterium]|nr:hypothetical protein [Synechococcales bacterium]